jgi:periplasmic protein TonB
MKREKHSSTLRRISLTLLLTAAVISTLFVAACGKTANSGLPGGEATASQSPASSTLRDTVLVYVEEMPVFPGGDNALLKYIAENTVYPEAAKKNNITGKVIVRFIVEKDCSVSDVTVLQSVDPLLDAEAIKVISSLPKFEKPAKNHGKPVAVWYMVPITFALK